MQQDFNTPVYFAVPDGMPTEDRAKVPAHIAEHFAARGRIEFVRAEPTFRLYRRHAA